MNSVIVLAGGNSDEREVSLRSGKSVTEALKKHGYQAEMLDPTDGLEAQLAKLQAADVIFPALHGAGGEDGVLQEFLEQNNICYVGADSKASALCFDKALYINRLVDNNILVPKTETVTLEKYEKSALTSKPHVLKPNTGGSSIDTFIIRNPDSADTAAIEEAFGHHKTLLLQELIDGVEITVAMLGSQSLPVVEIIPPQDGEFDYENKYNGQTQELCPPQHVDEKLQTQAQTLSKHIHELTGCRDMSRTDIIVTNNGQLYVLETNTIPGLTDESLLPKTAAEAGYDMPELCDRLVQTALKRNT